MTLRYRLKRSRSAPQNSPSKQVMPTSPPFVHRRRRRRQRDARTREGGRHAAWPVRCADGRRTGRADARRGSPRLAVFSTWGNTQDVGWVRHAFDVFEVGYDLIFKEQVLAAASVTATTSSSCPVRAGAPRPRVRHAAGRQAAGVPQDRPFKSLGMYGESDDVTGGMGLAGVLEIERFVQQGGVLRSPSAALSFFPAEVRTRARASNAARPSPSSTRRRPMSKPRSRSGAPDFYGYTAKTLPVRYAERRCSRSGPGGGPGPADADAVPRDRRGAC